MLISVTWQYEYLDELKFYQMFAHLHVPSFGGPNKKYAVSLLHRVTMVLLFISMLEDFISQYVLYNFILKHGLGGIIYG